VGSECSGRIRSHGKAVRERYRRNLEGLGMTVETPHLALLRRRLKARDGKKEYEKNCEAIREEIARLENCQGLDL
jgi:hypothetical protein